MTREEAEELIADMTEEELVQLHMILETMLKKKQKGKGA